jgi:beta-mannosidase
MGMQIERKLPRMFDQWKLQDFAPDQGRSAGAFEQDFDDSGWIPVDVPGDVHTALIESGRLPDPYYDRNELKCSWVEDREWWYRLTFSGPRDPLQPGERLQLVFDGLDTFATIWLNGHELGNHKNMFRPAVFDVTAQLGVGRRNTLSLCFDRPLDHCGDLLNAPTSSWMPPRAAMRKAQFGFGWDWGPRLPTVGIWREVELRRRKLAAIAGVRFATLEIDGESGRALVCVTVEAEHFAGDGPFQATATLRAPGDNSWAAVVAERAVTLVNSADGLHAAVYFSIDDAQLWWTHDLGEPSLYLLQVDLKHGSTVLDSVTEEVGIRTIALDQSPDQQEPGTRFFTFILNGVPVFARGTDWIPADSFVGAITPERYAKILAMARDGNNTMLRVWGGGIYEHEAFYDACDRLGILVWQDFMFACAAYPEDDAMVVEVEAEARYQVERLRNHPSLAIWCGNNENQWIYDKINWQDPASHVPGHLYYSRTLPEAVAAYDGHTPYWPGSPYGGSDHNSMEDGDRHNWDVWHGDRPRRFGQQPQGDHSPEGVSFVHYAEDTGRFISEFGMHAAPVFETLRRNVPADQLFHHSDSMDHHNKDNPKDKGDNLMATTTGLPRDLQEYVDFSMIAQAEGLKLGVEHFRRRFPHCSGALVWQLNDCWPVLSWSVLDYYGFGKAGYYYLQRAYAPVIATLKTQADGGVELWITNNSRDEVSDTAVVQLGTFDGESVWRENVRYHLPSATSRPVAQWPARQVNGSPRHYMATRSATGAFPSNRTFFCAIKDMERPPAEVDVATAALDAHTLDLRLTSRTFAYFVHLVVPFEDTVFSDNYFDLLPGETRVVGIMNSAREVRSEDVTVRWR